MVLRVYLREHCGLPTQYLHCEYTHCVPAACGAPGRCARYALLSGGPGGRQEVGTVDGGAVSRERETADPHLDLLLF